MDDLVEKALARWPNVPAISGWLRLSMQGDWLLTRPEAQGEGAEASLQISNSRILNFIARNYTSEPDGRYYFQNGPQKAYVTLDYTPWVYRLYPLQDGSLVLLSHTGLVVLPTSLWTDDEGRVLIESQLGVGVLHSSDVQIFSTGLQLDSHPTKGEQFIHQGVWTLPEHPEKDLAEQRIALRRLKNASDSGTFRLKLGLTPIETARVAAHFAFVTNPEVKS